MVSKSNSEVRISLDARLVHDFLDVIILKMLKKNKCLNGYDFTKYFHQKFRLLISSGTIYSTLYSLERKGLIAGDFDGRRRVYALTREGEEFFEEICSAGQRNQATFQSIFSNV